MELTPSELDPYAVAIGFIVAYVLIWFSVGNEGSWLFVSSALCLAFLCFTFDLSEAQRAALPLPSMLVATCHWGAVYLCLVSHT
jgi:hypothetical protein